MTKRLIISESEKYTIRKMYGLIVEQYKDGMIPAKGYQIIQDIEYNMGSAKEVNGKFVPIDTKHQGDEKEDIIKKYINECLTDEQWKKIDPLFRVQIYSFMFQAGSKSGQEYRWLAGLAQAINPSLDRSKIINDENYRKNACSTVNSAISNNTINSYYERYIQTLKTQYNSLTKPQGSTDSDELWQAKKDIAWNHRPDVIEDMYKTGKSIFDIMKIYFSDTDNTLKDENSISTSRNVLYGKDKKTQPQSNQQPIQQSQEKTDNQNTNNQKITINGNTFEEFRQNIKKNTKGILIDENSIKIDVENNKLTYLPGETQIENLSLVWSNISENDINETIKNSETKNSGLKRQTVDFGSFKDIKGTEFWWVLSIWKNKTEEINF
jgi:hypothetical protein